jgi:glycosyltransferase involved in cell wall biosynthesis
MTHHNDLIGDGLRPYIFDSYTAVSKRLLFAQVSKLLVVSRDHALSSRLQNEFTRRWDDVIEIPNGVDIDQFRLDIDGAPVRRSYGIRSSDKVILFVGALDRAHHFRRVDLLIDALKKLQRDDVHLILAGDGDKMEDYRVQAVDRNLENQVHFLGRVTHRELPGVYAAADMVVLPSHLQESFGMILIEGMACGKPVIASNLPGVRTVVDDGLDGLLVRAGDGPDLARKLDMMLQISPESRQEMGLAGRRKVEARYSWENIAISLEKIYFEVLNEQRCNERSAAQKEKAAAET